MALNQLPEKLTKLRKYYRYSQSDIAAKIGVTVQDYMNLENGNAICTIYQMCDLADLYHISVQALLDNSKSLVMPDEEKDGFSATIPFQSLRSNDDTLNIAAQNEETTEALGHTKVMSTASLADDPDEVGYEDEEDDYERPQRPSRALKEKDGGKKKQMIIIGALCAVAVLLVAVILIFMNQKTVTLSLTTTNRLALGDTYSMYIDKDGKLKIRGTVAGTGEFKNLVQVSAYESHVIGLKEDGTVVTNGNEDLSSWENITMIAAGENHSVGLTDEETVVCKGESGACAVSSWENITAVYAGNGFTIGLTENGTLEVAGDAPDGLAGTANVLTVAVGRKEVIVVDKDGKAKAYANTAASDLSSWSDITFAAVGNGLAAGLKEDGTVVLAANGDDEETLAVKETVESWTQIRYLAANGNTIIAVDKSGNMYGAGDNSYNQYEGSSTPTESPEAQQLATPENITFEETAENLTVKWNEVENADYYEVSIDTSPIQTFKAANNTVSFACDTMENGHTYKITIIACADDEEKYLPSQAGEKEYTYAAKPLDTPTDFEYTVDPDTGYPTLKWAGVKNAEYYNIMLDGEDDYQADGTEYTLDKILDNGTHKVEIYACTSNHNYANSEPLEASFEYDYTPKPIEYTVTIHYKLLEGYEDEENTTPKFSEVKSEEVMVESGTYSVQDLIDLIPGLDGYTVVGDDESYEIPDVLEIGSDEPIILEQPEDEV